MSLGMASRLIQTFFMWPRSALAPIAINRPCLPVATPRPSLGVEHTSSRRGKDTMPRALLGLIMLVAIMATGCDKKPAPPEPATGRAEAPVVPDGEAEQPPLRPVPAADISGLEEDAALIAVMKGWVAADKRKDQDAMARFVPVDADTLLSRPHMLLPDYLQPSAEPADSSYGDEIIRTSLAAVEQQIPADVRDAIRKAGGAKVLAAETCYPDVSKALGVPSDYDAESASQLDLDTARFQVALEREGQAAVEFPQDFRDPEGDRESVAALNAALFQMHQGGASKSILVVYDPPADCGAGEVPVKLTSNPPFKSLRIVPEFYFAVCGKRVADPWSPSQCRWWEDVLQEVSMVAGTYYYVATWADAPEKRGRFTIDEQTADALEQGQETLTLDIRQ